MKLLTFKCIQDKERMDECFEPDNQEEQWFAWLDDEKDEEEYDWVQQHLNNLKPTDSAWRGYYNGCWSGYMSMKLGDDYEDDDIFYYFLPEDEVPEVGGTFELDGLVWERIK